MIVMGQCKLVYMYNKQHLQRHLHRAHPKDSKLIPIDSATMLQPSHVLAERKECKLLGDASYTRRNKTTPMSLGRRGGPSRGQTACQSRGSGRRSSAVPTHARRRDISTTDNIKPTQLLGAAVILQHQQMLSLLHLVGISVLKVLFQ